MSTRRVTLHGIDPGEKSSPLKKQLSGLADKESYILKDGDYVDVKLETVLTSKPRKRMKTGKIDANSWSNKNDHLPPSFIDKRGEESLEMNFDAISDDFSSQLADAPECSDGDDFSQKDQGDDACSRVVSKTKIEARSTPKLENEAL